MRLMLAWQPGWWAWAYPYCTVAIAVFNVFVKVCYIVLSFDMASTRWEGILSGLWA